MTASKDGSDEAVTPGESGLAATLSPVSGPADFSTAADPLQTGRVVDRYVVLHRVGRGGMGIVYAAYDPQLDRKVAIKILRPDVASDAPRKRLLREAQAMARVSHPNVMRVYDVGTVDELVFMAMELVEGETLGELLTRTQPGWRESLRLFLAAGRGLAAAHAAGLVHRDFKPENVLAGQDHTVRVIDFGLARADKDVTPHAVELPHDIRESSGPTALDSALTRAGAFLGTPLYMSPEQLAGENADARSDQFSFCVAAYHALFGERPFTASSIEELRTVITKNRVNEPPKASRVPLHLRQALMRGLDAAPARRWPSMDALLFELEREPGAQLRRRLVAAVALGAVVVAGISWQAVRRHAHEACVQAGGDITRHWNDARKAKVHEAFTAANVPFAEHAWSTIERRLDGYASAWSAMRSEACEAATVDATQTEEQLRLRVACLDQREQELSALVDVLATADVKVVQGSVEAAHALTSISGCADLVALRAVRPPPSQPEAKAKIEAARAQLAVVKSLSDSGSLAAALDKARAATKLAHEIGYAPLISEAQLRQGDLEAKTGDRKSAEVTLQQAVRFAQVANADELAARAWNVLGFVIGFELGRHPEGEAFCRYAEAVIERQGGNPELTADNLRSMGLVLEHEGKFDEALKLLKDSLAVREKLTGAEHPAVATASSSVGNAYIMKAQFAEARPYQERALAIRLKLLGPQHPDTSKSYHNLAICLSHLGERARAVEYLEKALDVDSAVFGPHSDSTAQTRMTLGKAWFADHHPQQAREAAQIALEDLTQAFGADAPATSPTVLLLARIALAEGQLPEALGYFQRGLAIRAKQMGNNHEVLADYLTGIGECQLALHQPRLALASFERAGHLDNAARSSPEDRAKMNWGLARSIWESRGAKGEAIDRAVEAKTLYANTLDHSEDVQRLDGWLETHKL